MTRGSPLRPLLFVVMASGTSLAWGPGRARTEVRCLAGENGPSDTTKSSQDRQGLDAFISHASQDVELAERVERVLEANSLTVWLDRSEIRLGALLRNELQTAIKNSRVVILLWSSAAARSRWIAAEVLTAFHLGRFVVPCLRGKAPLPYFLQSAVYLNLRSRTDVWEELLRRAVRESPDTANEVLPVWTNRDPVLQQAIGRIAAAQYDVVNQLGVDLQSARKKQHLATALIVEAEKTWPLEPMILNLAGYHYKNAYMVRHWPAIQAGRPPNDALLERADRYFFNALFVNPNDYSALNGLGSTLLLERELDAAEFFVGRAVTLAERDGVDYGAAKQDLEMIVRMTRG